MSLGEAFAGGLRALGSGEFWSFRVIHAVLGGLLTVGGAAGALLVGDNYRKEIATVDSQIAIVDSRLESIKSTLAQFRIVQSNGIVLGALASGQGVAEDYRESFINLMFVLRRGPALSVLGEIYPNDVDAFDRGRDELDRLVALAVAPERTRQSWDDVLTFEMTHESQLMDLQTQFQNRKLELQAQEWKLQASKDYVTFTGFLVQQAGFVVILLAGLLYQHSTGVPVGPNPGTRDTLS